MQPNDHHLPSALDAPVSRRTLLRSAAGAGAGVLVGGLTGTALPGVAQAADRRLQSVTARELTALFEQGAAKPADSGRSADRADTAQRTCITTYGTGVLGERRSRCH